MERLPTLEELGADLLETTPWQRWQPIFMPYIYVAGFLVSAHLGNWSFAALFLVMLFSACSTSTHDVLHGSLGFNRQITEWLLFFLGLPILESGHAYRATHLKHHRSFPEHDDIEGEAAHLPIWKVLLTGPFFLPRLWLWAYRNQPSARKWLWVEASLMPLSLAIGVVLLPFSVAPMSFVVLVVLASWFYPVFAVNLPHRGFESERVRQAWTLRGLIIPKLFLPLAYHLEHHLYPKIPSHNLPKLAKRLEPHLAHSGVRLIRVP